MFGLGGESLTVAQNTYTIRWAHSLPDGSADSCVLRSWFEGPKLALAFGLVVSFARIGSSVNFVVTPKLANMDNGVPLSVWCVPPSVLRLLLRCADAASWFLLAMQDRNGHVRALDDCLLRRGRCRLVSCRFLRVDCRCV